MNAKSLLGILVLFSSLWAQTPPPLELPEVVIVGQEERRIPGGTKQEPRLPFPLPRPVLDTLAPLNKQALMDFLPLPAFPRELSLPSPVKGMLEGGVGQYTTGWLKGYQQWQWKQALLTLAAHAAGTQGHRRSADSIGMGVVTHLRLGLPTALWVFREGVAEAIAAVGWKRYRLFGDSALPRRSLFEGRAAVSFSGSLERLDYGLGAELQLFSLNHEARGNSEQQLAFRTWALYPNDELPAVGVVARLDLRFWEERTQTVSEVALPVAWGESTLLVQGKLGFQGARTYTGSGFFVPALEGTLQYGLSPQVRLLMALWSRLQEAGLREMVQRNPYVGLGAEPLLQHERIGVRVALGWVVQPWLTCEPAFRLRSVARWWSWQRDSVGFRLLALPVTALEGTVDLLWEMPLQGRLGVQFHIGRATAEGGRQVPYYTPITAAVYYEQPWKDWGRSIVGIELVGSRWATEEKLPGYTRVWGEMRGVLSPTVQVALILDNVLNSDIVQWQGYRERGIFIGATARLLW